MEVKFKYSVNVSQIWVLFRVVRIMQTPVSQVALSFRSLGQLFNKKKIQVAGV